MSKLFLIGVMLLNYSFVLGMDCHPDDYLRIRPDVKAAGISAEEHYATHGKNEGMCRPTKRTASRFNNSNLCTPEEYLKKRPDVKASGMSPIQHYTNHGYKEGMCKPSDDAVSGRGGRGGGAAAPSGSAPYGTCTPDEYLKKRPDVKAAGMTAAVHYKRHGIKEGMCEPSATQPSSTADLPSGGPEGESGFDGSGSGGTTGGGGKGSIKGIKVGNWAYIDDMVQTLNKQYPTDRRIECRFSGDTNASQDWVAAIMLCTWFSKREWIRARM